MAAYIFFLSGVYAQVTTPFNQGGSGNFVGWDNTVINDPLEIRHDANQPIQWYTDSIQRMQLYSTQNSTINTFNNVNQDGFVLLSGEPNAFTNVNSFAPFTRMHLIDDIGGVAPIVYAQQLGFRPWQRNGITFTGNRDQGYIGQQYMSPDATDMVFQWSDNP